MRFNIFIFLIALLACNNKTKITNESSQNEDNILFLTFKIFSDTVLQQNRLILTDKQIVQGTIKFSNPVVYDSNQYLKIQIFSQHKNRTTQYLKHPLYPIYEVEQNGTFEKRQLKLDTIEFFERIQVKGVPQFISVSEKLSVHDKEQIILNKFAWK